MSRRRELFPPDRALQARMVVASVATPLVVLVGVAVVVLLLPVKVIVAVAVAVAIAGAIGTALAVKARRTVDRPRLLAPGAEPELRAMVERLCVLADLPQPEIALHDECQPNSWMTDVPGRTPRLHVTTALLELLDGPELEAVVAHELAHVPARDLRAVAARDAFHLLPVERPGKGWAASLGRREPFRRLGATHPSLERRLAELERLERRMHPARPAPRVV